jgi:AcrR family transcriptional regulator
LLFQARRNQILDAAAATFAEKGFYNVTTKEIGAAAGVSEGTIYNYFGSKFDLLIGLLARLAEIEQLPGELSQARQDDVRAFFVGAFRQRLARIESGEEMLKAILPQVLVHEELREQFYERYVLPIADMLEQYIEVQVEQGHIRPVNVPLATRLVQGMFVGLLVLRILGDGPLHQDWDQVPELLATMVFDGLQGSEGG